MATRKRPEVPEELPMRLIQSRLESMRADPRDVERMVGFLDTVRSGSSGASPHVDRFLVGEYIQMRQGLARAQEAQRELRELHEEMVSPPWYPAIYLGRVGLEGQELAMVYHGGTRRAVAVQETVDREALGVGDEVLLDGDLNLVVGHAPNSAAPAGETALFNRYTSDRRMVLDWHDDEIVVDVADRLRSQQLTGGDRVRFDRNLWMALECIERSTSSKFILEETPTDTFAQIGGLEREIELIRRLIGTHMFHPEIVQRYKGERKGSILLVGSPGNGKTTLARAIANWLAEVSKTGSRFMNIKPAALHSVWYSKTESNYREVFQVARELGSARPEVPVVLFFDEVDSIAAERGHSLMQTDDRVLNALMTELDGFQKRGNVLVIAATNRRSMLDEAFVRPGRLGDLVVTIPRPGREAADQIFSVYMEPEIPYAAGSSREDVIAAALTRIYGPNSENELAKLMLRGGEQVSVRARDLMSGASIRNIVKGAKDSAILREAADQGPGVSVGDVLGAVEQEFDALVGMLSRANCRNYLPDLPDDADVVRIDRIARRPKNAHRFLTVA